MGEFDEECQDTQVYWTGDELGDLSMKIAGDTRVAAVLGWPVHHSRSPAMHNAAFAASGINAVYVALPVQTEQLAAVIAGLRGCNVLGINLTVPHKAAVMPLCDEISEAAREIGAVNTLEFCQDGRLIGHNTDAEGYVRSFSESLGESIQGRKVVVLGGGGAARAVAFGATQAGAESVQCIVRQPDTVQWTSAKRWQASTFATVLPVSDVLIDCTSMALAEPEAKGPSAIDLGLLPDHAIVSTLVYHRETQLLTRAHARGLRTLDGSGMLVHQGALAFKIWTGVVPSSAVMRAALSCLER